MVKKYLPNHNVDGWEFNLMTAIVQPVILRSMSGIRILGNSYDGGGYRRQHVYGHL